MSNITLSLSLLLIFYPICNIGLCRLIFGLLFITTRIGLYIFLTWFQKDIFEFLLKSRFFFQNVINTSRHSPYRYWNTKLLGYFSIIHSALIINTNFGFHYLKFLKFFFFFTTFPFRNFFNQFSNLIFGLLLFFFFSLLLFRGAFPYSFYKWKNFVIWVLKLFT